MTEKEKMLAQMLYDALDAELRAERQAAKDLCFALNALRPSDEAERRATLEKLLGAIGENAEIMPPFWCDYGTNIRIGNNFFANHNTVILDCARVTFGENVFVGPNCGFYTASHPIDAKRRNEGLESAHPISVGDNVWIGGGVHVLPGVSIGSNVVIGAGSVVTKDIPSNCVAVGNPCRPVKAIEESGF